MRILLVEDDVMIADAISTFLTKSEFSCDLVENLKDAHLAAASTEYDAIILDLNLPDGCGLSLLRKLRQSKQKTPVLVLTARNTIIEKITGLDLGADDYLSKPFDLHELVARLRAVYRRVHDRATTEIVYQHLTVIPASFCVELHGIQRPVPVSQFRLLQYLLDHCGRIKTKEQIIDALYSWDEGVAGNTIEVYVSQLRKLLWPELIKTVRGVGYMVPKLD